MTANSVRQTMPGTAESIRQNIPGPAKSAQQNIPGPAKSIRQNIPGPAKSAQQNMPGPAKSIRQNIPGPAESIRQTMPGPAKSVQQIMLGTVTKNEKQALGTLRAIRAAGFDGIELNGFMIRPTPFIVQAITALAGMPTGKGGKFDWKALTEEAGLTVTGIHEDLGSIQRDPDAIIAEAEKFGTDKIILTGMYRFDYSDRKAVAGLARDLNTSGEILKKGGVQLLYHNHNCEFRKLDKGQTAYDYLIENTDPAFLNFELDSYWPTEAGVPALDLMKKLGSRMKLYHINDRGTKVKGPSMTPILKSDSMELGTGNMNLEELIDQAVSVQVSAIVLESHKNWIDKSPIRSIQVSGAYLNRVMK